MAIIIDEPDVSQAQSMTVYSDAATNAEAVREISKWVREHGFVRPKDYWLKQTMHDGKLLFQSQCRRLTEDDLRAADQRLEAIAQRREQLPLIDLATLTK